MQRPSRLPLCRCVSKCCACGPTTPVLRSRAATAREACLCDTRIRDRVSSATNVNAHRRRSVNPSCLSQIRT
ncbi:hypothetical protein EXIGLDRAFT_731059 [Exidia glandulosa HHB12029]|uniref:Uncharacterized protein n=1 Tax=Exidia glandulosa HHB12029 TaxID=1314781 RepID=A0A165L4V4_EXIGL|nr:hypothetical protein EXIGLDRAFT_731059 [Exidia glandulosa HHB12029]